MTIKGFIGLIAYLLLLTEAAMQSYNWSRCQMVREGYVSECDPIQMFPVEIPMRSLGSGQTVIVTATTGMITEWPNTHSLR